MAFYTHRQCSAIPECPQGERESETRLFGSPIGSRSCSRLERQDTICSIQEVQPVFQGMLLLVSAESATCRLQPTSWEQVYFLQLYGLPNSPRLGKIERIKWEECCQHWVANRECSEGGAFGNSPVQQSQRLTRMLQGKWKASSSWPIQMGGGPSPINWCSLCSLVPLLQQWVGPAAHVQDVLRVGSGQASGDNDDKALLSRTWMDIDPTFFMGLEKWDRLRHLHCLKLPWIGTNPGVLCGGQLEKMLK